MANTTTLIEGKMIYRIAEIETFLEETTSVKKCTIDHRFNSVCSPIYVCEYLANLDQLKQERLVDPEWDIKYKAIISFLLQFDLQTFVQEIKEFAMHNPNIVSDLHFRILNVLLKKVNNNEKYQYLCVSETNENIPIYDGYLGVFLISFKTSNTKIENITPNWKMKDSLYHELVEIYKNCIGESESGLPFISQYKPYLEGLPYSEDLYNGHYFLTGTACVGKSTFLKELKPRGIETFSRGSLGSFAGKSKCAVSINNLYVSLGTAHSQKNTLGDRGIIDNPLWVGIMTLCDPKYHKTAEDFVRHCWTFLRTSFTNPWVGYYYMACRGYVIVDLKPKETQKRLLLRAQNTDILRSRMVPFYSLTQTVVYYAIARMMGWKIISSPYVDDKWSPDEYLKLIDDMEADIKNHKPIKTLPDDVKISKTEKALPYVADLHYAKFVGIYK
jgi:hypothetical protein